MNAQDEPDRIRRVHLDMNLCWFGPKEWDNKLKTKTEKKGMFVNRQIIFLAVAQIIIVR